MLIKFNDSDKLYNLQYLNKGREVILRNHIDVVPNNISGFMLIDDFDNKTILADHSNHTFIYSTSDESITYVNTFVDYYVIFIYNSDNYVIKADIRRNNKLNSNEVIYKVIPELEYKETIYDVIDSDGFYLYKIVNNKIIKVSKSEKNEWLNGKLVDVKYKTKKYINNTCANSINSGIDYNGEHYSYAIVDQSNINKLVQLANSTGMEVPYHADGKDCRLFTVEEIIGLYVAQDTNLTHHLTYSNQLKQYVDSLTDIDVIKNIVYGQELTGMYLDTYNTIMAQTTNITTRFING